MALRDELEAILKEPPVTPADAERAAQAAAALAAYLRLEEETAVLTDRSVPAAPAGRPAGSLDALTLHDAAEVVLERAGSPLHVRELGKRIKAGGWKHKRSRDPRPDQILYQLAARLPRHPETFVRVAPNTFGLVRWGKERRTRPKPRLATFEGPGRPIGREIGENPDIIFEGATWR
jgi:hypothetical protein